MVKQILHQLCEVNRPPYKWVESTATDDPFFKLIHLLMLDMTHAVPSEYRYCIGDGGTVMCLSLSNRPLNLWNTGEAVVL